MLVLWCVLLVEIQDRLCSGLVGDVGHRVWKRKNKWGGLCQCVCIDMLSWTY